MSTIDQYVSFVTIIETKSLATAAKTLNRSPSTISKHLSKLEERLDTRLIDRNTMSLSATKIGQSFYDDCKEIINRINEAELQLQEDQTKVAGTITISVPRILLDSLLFKYLNNFSQQYPDICFNVKVSDRNENLIDSGVDFALRNGPLADNQLMATKLIVTNYILCASKKYIDRMGTPDSFVAIKSHQIIIPSFSYLNNVDFIKMISLHSPGLEPLLAELMKSNKGLTIDDSYGYKMAILEGLGIGFMLDQFVAKEIQQENLIHLFPELSFPNHEFYLVYQSRDYMPMRMKVFKAYLVECYRKDSIHDFGAM
ncbi:MAG: hypothetical protein COA99_15295 [Moraxellaceae bacterium]|nr:MAG: hypothetical protein COA99_15295 [Moraxellaceae bacterium]